MGDQKGGAMSSGAGITSSEPDEVRAALRREVGPSGQGDGNWQPMVAASEVWVLLDALDAVEAVLGDVEAEDFGGITAELIYDIRAALRESGDNDD